MPAINLGHPRVTFVAGDKHIEVMDWLYEHHQSWVEPGPFGPTVDYCQSLMLEPDWVDGWFIPHPFQSHSYLGDRGVLRFMFANDVLTIGGLAILADPEEGMPLYFFSNRPRDLTESTLGSQIPPGNFRRLLRGPMGVAAVPALNRYIFSPFSGLYPIAKLPEEQEEPLTTDALRELLAGAGGDGATEAVRFDGEGGWRIN